MKLTYVNQTYKTMFPIKNGFKSINALCTGSHKSFSMHYSLQGKIFLKCILSNVYCTKYNETNICHLDVQKHGSYEERYK